MTNERLRQSIEQLTDNNFHKLPLNGSFERVTKVAEERAAFNEQMAILAELNAAGFEIKEKSK